ncbi:Rho termination factor N-terminal domain-containing protein [Gimesia maris]|uniref:Rho termination factor N-terminal domain-containing protein n=1 Tax=Gimesia maris TaxID=122 RepID=UPI0030D7BD9E|tara:strand:+ start:44317 stop:44616 length:300 start_codon:yes stop_codon:yes gene_type:complete
MPTAWNEKDERQYQHIKESALDRGRSEDKAEEIAARTVNKQRRQAGKTPNQTTQGTGNPHSRLEDRTVDELQNLAAENNIQGRSKMKKAELIDALRDKQ